MRTFRNKYLSNGRPYTVLDVGSRWVGGAGGRTYREFFQPPKFTYVGMDIEAGKNVDIIGYENIKEVYDVLISGQVMEHLKRPWEWLVSLKQYFSIYICVIAPNTHKEHRHPLDTYRYFPDGMRDLFEYAEIKELEIYLEGDDTIGIGTK
jgi:hypothetical protein